eukprot:COSAG03_NODE_6571_length_1039_cov_1.270213_1_plen_98_part_00
MPQPQRKVLPFAFEGLQGYTQRGLVARARMHARTHTRATHTRARTHTHTHRVAAMAGVRSAGTSRGSVRPAALHLEDGLRVHRVVGERPLPTDRDAQ